MVWAVCVLGFTFPPPVCLQVRGLCHGQETLWFLSTKKKKKTGGQSFEEQN